MATTSPFSSASNYTGAFREEVERRKESDRAYEESFEAAGEDVKSAGQNWSAAQTFLGEASNLYMKIKTEEIKKKKADAQGIARRESITEQELEEVEERIRDLEEEKKQGRDVKTKLEAELKRLGIGAERLREILAEADSYSSGFDRVILEQARAKEYFSDGGQVQQDWDGFLAVKEEELRKKGLPLPTSIQRRALYEQFVNQTLANKWGNADKSWLKTNIYPIANEWQDKKDKQEVKISNAAQGWELRQTAKATLQTKDFNINTYLYDVANSTSDTGDGVYGYSNAHKLLLIHAKELSDAGIDLPIESWAEHKLYGPGFPKKGMAFKNHATYKALLDIEQQEINRNYTQAEQGAKINGEQFLNNQTDELDKGIEAGNVYEQPFINQLKEEWDVNNPDASDTERTKAHNTLQGYAFDADAVDLEHEQLEHQLLTGTLKEEDLANISVHNRAEFTDKLRLFGDSGIHKANFTAIENLVINQNRDLAENSRPTLDMQSITMDLKRKYVSTYFALMNKEDRPGIQEALNEAAEKTQTYFENQGGAALGSDQEDVTNKPMYHDGTGYPHWNTGLSTTNKARKAKVLKAIVNKESDERPGRLKVIHSYGIKDNIWNPAELTDIILDFNRGQGELGGYVPKNVKEIAKILKIDPYDLIKAQYEAAKKFDADIKLPPLEERKNYPNDLLEFRKTLNSEQADLLYGDT